MSALLWQLHHDLLRANRECRAVYNETFTGGARLRGGCFTEGGGSVRKECNRHLAVFVPLERALHKYLDSQSPRHKTLVLGFANRVMAFLKSSERVLPVYADLSFPVNDDIWRSVLSGRWAVELPEEGGLTGAQIREVLGAATAKQIAQDEANLHQLARLLAKELSPEAFALLEWAAERQVNSAKLVKAIRLQQMAEAR